MYDVVFSASVTGKVLAVNTRAPLLSCNFLIPASRTLPDLQDSRSLALMSLSVEAWLLLKRLY